MRIRFIRLAGLGDVVQTLWALNQFDLGYECEFITYKKHAPVLNALKLKLKILYIEYDIEMLKFSFKPTDVCVCFHTNSLFNFIMKLQSRKFFSWTEKNKIKKNKLPYISGHNRLAQLIHLVAFSGISLMNKKLVPLCLHDGDAENKINFDILIFPSGGNNKQPFGARRVSDQLIMSRVALEKSAVVICGANDFSALKFANTFKLPVIENMSTQLLISLFSAAKKTISGDTGLAHLAIALGIETEVFCGPTDGEVVFGKHDWLTIWQSSVICSPCYLEKTSHRHILEKCRNPICMAAGAKMFNVK